MIVRREVKLDNWNIGNTFLEASDIKKGSLVITQYRILFITSDLVIAFEDQEWEEGQIICEGWDLIENTFRTLWISRQRGFAIKPE